MSYPNLIVHIFKGKCKLNFLWQFGRLQFFNWLVLRFKMTDNIPDVRKKQLELQLAFCVMSCVTNQMIYYKKSREENSGQIGNKNGFQEY